MAKRPAGFNPHLSFLQSRQAAIADQAVLKHNKPTANEEQEEEQEVAFEGEEEAEDDEKEEEDIEPLQAKNLSGVRGVAKTYRCDLCSKNFAAASGLWYHNKHVHGAETQLRPRKPKKTPSPGV